MGKVKRFEVLFDNGVGAFYAGTQVSGKVLLELSDSIKVYGETSITSRSEVVSSGIHEFQFSFSIPQNIPSSFESDLGHVRYWCRASLHRPWTPDQTVKKAFSVVGVLDLNHEPLAFVSGRCSPKLCSLLFKAQPSIYIVESEQGPKY
ncbi:unnamed protein product [Soboliphyme baturini]|uniref:Arrestin_N domain-containing protein n=1 Tax=Soboliphyme baturini TaxID=241478 RepID=A0A183J3W8_9BILA|nr:unnamed protein product [Soboliphyme baturini]